MGYGRSGASARSGANIRYRARDVLAGILLFALTLSGCETPEGTVEVDVGQAPLAAAYRVDLYADQGGLDLVEGKAVVNESTATFEGVEEGRWSVLIQAENGDGTTIAHYIGKVQVKANETVQFQAGTYVPGMPGSLPPESDTEIDSFGPDGSALLTAIYGPGVDNLPAAAASLTASSGQGEQIDTTGAGDTLNRLAPDKTIGCATAWIAAQDQGQVNSQTSTTPPRANYGSLAVGQSASFFIATTFKETEAVRILSDSQTEHCLVFAEVVDGTPVIGEARALEVAAAFDRDNPFQEGDNGVYNETRERVGSEWVTNPVGGRDKTDRVVFVFLSSQSIGGEGFFGFFRPQDEESQEKVSTSNVGEILFLNADRANDDLYDAMSTISHEFTHLILWNQKVGRDGTFPEGGTLENATIDEGLAVLNEDLSGFTYTGEQGGNFFLLAAVDALLTEGLNRAFFQFAGGLDDYGAGYLLCRFLHDQYGPEKMKEITTSPNVGRDNIATVLSEPFPAVFANFAQAVALNGEEGVPEELSYASDVDLHGSYIDRDGETFEYDGLQGIGNLTLPGTFNNDVQIEPWGTVFFRATGGDGSPLTWKATGAESLLTRIYDSRGAGVTSTETPSSDPTPVSTATP